MNNIEKITYIQNDIKKLLEDYTIFTEGAELFERILNVFEELKEPQSLADFLGWEKNTEYVYKDYKYKTINNTLYFTRTKNNWIKICDFDVTGLRKAKKVIYPKKYRFKLKKEYALFINKFYVDFYLVLCNEKYILHDSFYENDTLQFDFTEEEIANIVLPEPLSLDMFDIE